MVLFSASHCTHSDHCFSTHQSKDWQQGTEQHRVSQHGDTNSRNSCQSFSASVFSTEHGHYSQQKEVSGMVTFTATVSNRAMSCFQRNRPGNAIEAMGSAPQYRPSSVTEQLQNKHCTCNKTAPKTTVGTGWHPWKVNLLRITLQNHSCNLGAVRGAPFGIDFPLFSNFSVVAFLFITGYYY